MKAGEFVKQTYQREWLRLAAWLHHWTGWPAAYDIASGIYAQVFMEACLGYETPSGAFARPFELAKGDLRYHLNARNIELPQYPENSIILPVGDQTYDMSRAYCTVALAIQLVGMQWDDRNLVAHAISEYWPGRNADGVHVWAPDQPERVDEALLCLADALDDCEDWLLEYDVRIGALWSQEVRRTDRWMRRMSGLQRRTGRGQVEQTHDPSHARQAVGDDHVAGGGDFRLPGPGADERAAGERTPDLGIEF